MPRDQAMQLDSWDAFRARMDIMQVLRPQDKNAKSVKWASMLSNQITPIVHITQTVVLCSIVLVWPAQCLVSNAHSIVPTRTPMVPPV
jgi:hypothetical protein